MLKGNSTLAEYDECLKKGLCDEHLKELNQNDLAAMKNDFPKKAFKFVRVNVLYPFLTNRPPKCEKMKKLMEKTPAIAKVLCEGKPDHKISEEAANVILTVDSVVIFTICQLSEICCIGAIFHTKKNLNDTKISSIQHLLLVERLNADIGYLFPVIEKNFTGFDLDIVRASHCITLLFIRKFCSKRSLKIALESMEKDIKTNCEFDQVTVVCSEYNYKNMSCVIQKTSTSTSSLYNFYSSTDYKNASEFYCGAKNFELASFYGYLAVSMEDSVGEAYYPFIKALIAQQLFAKALDVIRYGIEHTEKSSKHLKKLTKLLEVLTKRTSENNCIENAPNLSDINDKSASKRKKKTKSDLVDLVDSDSAGSDSEVKKNASRLADVLERGNSNEIGEIKEIKPERKEEPINKLLVCIKENSVAQDVVKLVNAADTDDESEIKKKKQIMNGTKEKIKSKSSRRKRTPSEGSVDNQLEDEIDINKISSYLKEASEALLADCGYKAVQIFRGPLRKFIESSDLLSFEECDIVCIKYSYGIAYCKSGGHDDLVKCIDILEDIIKKHDSIKFPAAYYSLGLASRKLNRFKEALNYLEIVQNFLDKRIHFKVYPWPGMTAVIQETKPDILKDLVQDLIKECENPPNPDALCRYRSCPFQRTIYYTDPDFKGYISLFCSEQCNLQYHLQCWKNIKEEKNLTDKEFLEKMCFTPDCEGFIAKIQNIDKKGDLSKEFSSEFKKPQKLSKKWEKKSDVKEKEKKKKKTALRSEGGSQEILTESGRNRSRQSSICDNETTEIRKEYSRESSICDKERSEIKNEYSRESSICDNETTSQLSDFRISHEEIPFNPEFSQKSSESLKLKIETPVDSSSNCASSSPQEDSISNILERYEKVNIPCKEDVASKLEECIKHNTYSYMADFLRHHGPLRIDDPKLTTEVELFPNETKCIVLKSGGIGEFLKHDLEFAFVGDQYICVIDDLAKAYHMLSSGSLLNDFKNFPPLGSNHLKYYQENEALLDTMHSSFLNPDAQEYTPSSRKNSAYGFATNDSNPQDVDSHCSLPLKLESSYKSTSSVSELDTFPGTEILVSKSKSCEAFSSSKCQANAVSVVSSSHPKEKNSHVTNESENKHEWHSNESNPGSEIVDESSLNNFVGKNINFLNGPVDKPHTISDGSSTEGSSSKFTKIEAQLLCILNKYFSEEMTNDSVLSSLKSFVAKKMVESVSTGTMTDIKFQLEENETLENHSSPDQDIIIECLKGEIDDLSKQNSSLHNKLECSAEQQQKLTDEVTRLKKFISDSTRSNENMKKEFDKKEKDLLKEKESLVQCLSDSNKFLGKVQQRSVTLEEEKLKLQKAIDNLTLSVKKEEEKSKNALNAQEKKFNAIIESLHKENTELKNRTKHAELQVLYAKKTEYLKRIEAKSLEMNEVKKEMNSLSMQLWANAAGPEKIKALNFKLNTYADELLAFKLDFVEKIDEQIKKVKSGTSLNDLKEIVMKDLAPVPTYKSILPEHLLAGVPKFNPLTLPYFGNAAIVPPVPTTSPLFPSSTSALNIVPPSTAATKNISPISPVVAARIIPPVATNIISHASTNLIPSSTIIPPSTPASLSSLSSSVPSVLKANKIDLVNDIDPTIQESFKSAMASINSFASSPYTVPLDGEFDKKCAAFQHPDPVPNEIKTIHPKGPPGLVNSSVPPSASIRASAIPSPIPDQWIEAHRAIGEKSYAGLDAVPKINVPPNQRAWEPEKKKTTITASYSKLLDKLREQFPTYSQEELLSYVQEVRAQRQGKLTGLTIDAIVAEISAIMQTKKKMPELKVQPKPPVKVLLNKNLSSDPKPPIEPQATKKKPAWNIDSDAAQRRFSGSADDDCTICCDSMANSPYKVACGHFFHEDCIRQWLKKNSNCPICRVLLLLPDEYPSLS